MIYKTVSDEDMRVHTRCQGRVALAGRMLITQGDIDITVPAPVEQLSESGALLREDREASVPQIVELEPGDARVLAGALPGSAQAIYIGECADKCRKPSEGNENPGISTRFRGVCGDGGNRNRGP